ncbi:MAG: methionine/alanine import family NSS transporter small subunit [Mobilicoccus sp.]|nr:methionine/alanine import family NSS transporter small subunit [Mobilicoccus sp.]
MSTESIIMMVIAIATVFGGQVLAIMHLRSHPDESRVEED